MTNKNLTDNLHTPTFPMGYDQLKDYLPHRYPFLLVDKVLSAQLEDETASIHAFKNVTINEPFFVGHFPDNPIMPGVLILEAMAQTAGVLAFINEGVRAVDGYLFLFAGVEKLRFKRPVLPGDTLNLQASLTDKRRDIYKFVCTAKVDDKTVASANITLAKQSTSHLVEA